MKSVKQIAFAALLTMGAFGAVTLVSCSKEDDVCAVGLEGSDCKTEVRTKYVGTYKGSGSDNTGKTYTNWSTIFAVTSTTPTKMTMVLADETSAPAVALTITLKSNTTFDVDAYTTTDNFTYTGTGSITSTQASLTLNQKDNEDTPPSTIVFTFNNMTKQ